MQARMKCSVYSIVNFKCLNLFLAPLFVYRFPHSSCVCLFVWYFSVSHRVSEYFEKKIFFCYSQRLWNSSGTATNKSLLETTFLHLMQNTSSPYFLLIIELKVGVDVKWNITVGYFPLVQHYFLPTLIMGIWLRRGNDSYAAQLA